MGTLVNTNTGGTVDFVGTSAGVRSAWVKRRALGGLQNKPKSVRRKQYKMRAIAKR